MNLKELVNEFGALKFWIGAIIFGTLTLNGVYQFLRDAPAIVNANTSHIQLHHDSLAELSDAVETFQVHSAQEEELFREQVDRLDRLDSNVDYLVCLRTERARELDNLPSLRNCEEVLLNR